MLKLDHFAFEVTNMDKAVAFYGDVLGLELKSRGVNEEVNEAYAFFGLGECTLELLSNTSPGASMPKLGDNPLRTPHLAFQTDDMDATLDMMREKNIPIIKGPLEIPGKERWVYFSDPDGNILEFIQWE